MHRIQKCAKPASNAVFSRNFSKSAALRFDIINPANGQKIKTVADDNAQVVKAKVDIARHAQPFWASVSLKDKKEIITKFGELLAKNQASLAETLTSEVGKPINQATNEVKALQPRIKFFLDNIDAALQPRVARTTDAFSEEVRMEPLGVVGNISAWNYPYFVGTNVIIPALLTGNSVVYKPSEHSTLTGGHITDLLHEAGVPKDVFSMVVGGGKTGEALLESDINGIFFTGSHSTGKHIAKKVGERMIRVQLELGGKDPSYVSNNADIEKVAPALADGAFYNTGQSCCSVERIYVHKDVYDRFVELFVKEVKGFTVGEPTDSSTYIGPLTLHKQVSILEHQVDDAVKKGAKVLVGGKKMKKNGGNWFEPTVLVNVNHTMEIMKEESFGPVIGIMKVSSVEEAIHLMNDTTYGLTSGVYTKSREEAEHVLSNVHSGTVYWNACDRVSPWLPWSGRRGSGIGCTLGLEGIQAFVQPKAWHLIKP